MANRRAVTYIRKTERSGNKQRERIVQRALRNWLIREYPDIVFFNDWASGAYLTTGQNSQRAAIACPHGWIDLFIAEPSRGYHGLFIELKREGVRPFLKDGKTLCADPQIQKEAEFLLKQNKKGYFARFACGLEQAQKLIDWYFETDRPENLTIF